MATRLDYSTSATPVVLHATGEGQADVHSIASDLGRSLGGNGSIAVDWSDTLPTTFPTYIEVDNTAAGVQLNTDAGANDFIWVKNTGRDFGTTTSLGVASLATLDLYLGDPAGAGVIICTLSPGAGILIPKPGTTYNQAAHYYLVGSSATSIAVEWAVGT